MVDGKVDASKSASVKAFQAAAKKITEGLNPRSTGIQIDTSLGPGGDMIPLKGVTDVFTDKTEDIHHKPG